MVLQDAQSHHGQLTSRHLLAASHDCDMSINISTISTWGFDHCTLGRGVGDLNVGEGAPAANQEQEGWVSS